MWGRCGTHLIEIHFSDLDRWGRGNQGKASASISSVLRCSSNSSHRHTHSWSSTETSRIPSPIDNHVALGKIWCSTPAGGYSQSNDSQHIQKTPSMISPPHIIFPPQNLNNITPIHLPSPISCLPILWPLCRVVQNAHVLPSPVPHLGYLLVQRLQRTVDSTIAARRRSTDAPIPKLRPITCRGVSKNPGPKWRKPEDQKPTRWFLGVYIYIPGTTLRVWLFIWLLKMHLRVNFDGLSHPNGI